MTPRDRLKPIIAALNALIGDPLNPAFHVVVRDLERAIAEAEDAARKDEREACAEATKVASGCCDECDAAIALIQEAIRTRGGAP